MRALVVKITLLLLMADNVTFLWQAGKAKALFRYVDSIVNIVPNQNYYHQLQKNKGLKYFLFGYIDKY